MTERPPLEAPTGHQQRRRMTLTDVAHALPLARTRRFLAARCSAGHLAPSVHPYYLYEPRGQGWTPDVWGQCRATLYIRVTWLRAAVIPGLRVTEREVPPHRAPRAPHRPRVSVSHAQNSTPTSTHRVPPLPPPSASRSGVGPGSLYRSDAGRHRRRKTPRYPVTERSATHLGTP